MLFSFFIIICFLCSERIVYCYEDFFYFVQGFGWSAFSNSKFRTIVVCFGRSYPNYRIFSNFLKSSGSFGWSCWLCNEYVSIIYAGYIWFSKESVYWWRRMQLDSQNFENYLMNKLFLYSIEYLSVFIVSFHYVWFYYVSEFTFTLLLTYHPGLPIFFSTFYFGGIF